VEHLPATHVAFSSSQILRRRGQPCALILCSRVETRASNSARCLRLTEAHESLRRTQSRLAPQLATLAKRTSYSVAISSHTALPAIRPPLGACLTGLVWLTEESPEGFRSGFVETTVPWRDFAHANNEHPKMTRVNPERQRKFGPTMLWAMRKP
jgi:hypothetical protein